LELSETLAINFCRPLSSYAYLSQLLMFRLVGYTEVGQYPKAISETLKCLLRKHVTKVSPNY